MALVQKIGQVNPGSTFSMIEIVVALYHGGFVRFDPLQRKFLDRVLISKGHATVALYPILAAFGVLPESEWKAWGKTPSVLRVFGNNSIPGIDATSGSLGHGIGVGAGMAMAFKRLGSDKRVFVVISEGELYEGSTWEGLLFATHYGLANLTVIIDINSLIILGRTHDCLALNPIRDKISGLGLSTIETEGLHDSWMIKRNLESKVSNPTIDALYEKARAAGALGGKLLGAGGGGFLLAFVPPERRKAVEYALAPAISVPVKFDRSGSRVLVFEPE